MPIVDFPVKPEARPYLEAFGRGAFGRDQGEPDWLAGYRKGALPALPSSAFRPGAAKPGVISICAHSSRSRCLPAERGAPSPSQRRALSSAEIGLAEPALGLCSSTDASRPSSLRSTELPAGVWFGSMAAAIAERPDLRAAATRSTAGRCRPTLRGAQRRVFRRRLRPRHRSRDHARSAGRDRSPVVGRDWRLAAHPQSRRARRGQPRLR